MTWREAGLTGLPEVLYIIMSDLSEEYWAAGWMSGTEYDLWRVLNGETVPGWPLTPGEVERLRVIRDAAQCWIVYEDGPKAVPLPEWRDRFARLGVQP